MLYVHICNKTFDFIDDKLMMVLMNTGWKITIAPLPSLVGPNRL